MKVFSVIDVTVLALFTLMAIRAFRSRSKTDILLGLVQGAGLALMLSSCRESSLILLLLTAVVYLVSQLATGARPLSRLLPIGGAVAALLALLTPR